MIKSNSELWRRKIFLFLISQSITLFGSTLVQMAIIWYVTIKTSSGIWVAAFTICAYLPQFVISFIGGVWADRYSRKILIICSDTGIAAVTLLMILTMPFLNSDNPLLTGLLLMSIIRSIGAGIQVPAVHSMIPQIVPKESLMRYNGINASIQSIVQFTAPVAAGVVFSLGSLRSILMIDVITAVIGILMLALIFIPKLAYKSKKEKVFMEMKIGLRYIFAQKTIKRLLLIYGIFTLLCVPGGFLAGLFVRRIFGETYWYLTAVELVGFAGMMLSGILMSVFGKSKKRIKILFYSLLFFGCLAIGMSLSKNFFLYLSLMFFFGIFLTSIQISITTLIQEKTNFEMQGRVLGLQSSMYSGFLPLGMALFGPLADIIELEWIMLISGVFVILLALFVKYSRYLYRV